jgi:hypothetical protein
MERGLTMWTAIIWQAWIVSSTLNAIKLFTRLPGWKIAGGRTARLHVIKALLTIKQDRRVLSSVPRLV